jgi:ribonuclease HII
MRIAGTVAGIDEAGRGPLAGPVVAAAAVIDRTAAKRRLLKLINDSKQLEIEDREAAYEAMVASGLVKYAVAEATVEEIDRFNILQATFLAMRRALEALSQQPDVRSRRGSAARPRRSSAATRGPIPSPPPRSSPR